MLKILPLCLLSGELQVPKRQIPSLPLGLLTGKGLRVIIYFMILVIVDGEQKRLDKKRLRVEALLKRLHINPETALALRTGELLTEDEDLLEGDTCVIMVTTGAR